MELALSVTQTVLAREQRLSALGGLAAAAAHELGTPLATISVVARELVRAAPDDTIREDAELLVSQAERCREILRRLTDDRGGQKIMDLRGVGAGGRPIGRHPRWIVAGIKRRDHRDHDEIGHKSREARQLRPPRIRSPDGDTPATDTTNSHF